MQAEILIISEEQPPLEFIDFLVKNGFNAHFSRGPLRIKEILSKESIDSIAWYGIDTKGQLTDDIIDVLNLHQEIPVLLITNGSIDNDVKKYIINYFDSADIQDSFKSIRNKIEKSLLQYRLNSEEPEKKANTQIREIDFLHVVKSKENQTNKTNYLKNALKIEAPWNVVNKVEKEMIMDFTSREKSFFSKAFHRLGDYFKS